MSAMVVRSDLSFPVLKASSVHVPCELDYLSAGLECGGFEPFRIERQC